MRARPRAVAVTQRSCRRPFFPRQVMNGFNELVETRRQRELADVHCVGCVGRYVLVASAESVSTRLRVADEHPRNSRDSSGRARRRGVADPRWQFYR